MSKLSTHHRRARDFIQREDWDNALSELQRVLGADGNNPTLHNQVGDVYLRKDDVVQACEHFEKSIELYATLGLHNNAVALCRKVIRLCPSRLEVRYRLARMRFEQSLRADAAISFGDYLDHVHPDSEHAGEVLEERCREITEGFPDDAPVGKILEKLEGQRSFACAFEIVQRLAQRAADSGNDAAARRFTEKMRSLRVLVERSGGGDILSADPVPPPIETGDAPAEPGAAAAPQIVEPEPEMAARLESDRAPAGAPADSPPEVETESGGVEWQPPRLVDDGLPDAALAAVESGPADAPAARLQPAAGGEDRPELRDPDAGIAEYELPETSLEEVAGLLRAEEIQGQPPEEPTAAASHSAHPEPVTTPAPESPWVASVPPEPVSPAGEVPPSDPQPLAPAPTGNWREDVQGAPVWIPDAFTPLEAPERPEENENGQVHELEDVIDTFREQMARALGDDAAARYDLGVAYYEMGLYNEALAEFEAAVRCDGFQEQSLEMMAACLAMQGRHAEIVELLSPVLESEPRTSSRRLGLRYSVGVALEVLGHPEEARRHFEEVALVDIGFKDVQARLQRP